MLKRRLVPKLQLKARQIGRSQRKVLVTTRGFDGVIEVGDPVAQAKIYESQAADELVFLDLDSAAPRSESTLALLRRAAAEIFMPFCVGGGVRTMDDFDVLMRSGADKVSLNTHAVRTPGLVTDAARAYGSQAVVVSIDYRDVAGRPTVFVEGGRTATDWHAVEWAREAERLGAGEILLTSIDRDGSGAGLDVATTREVAGAVGIPVVASGGCGLASHFVEGFVAGRADAVAAGTFFCFRDQNPMQTRAHIANAGVPIRMHR